MDLIIVLWIINLLFIVSLDFLVFGRRLICSLKELFRFRIIMPFIFETRYEEIV